jgi:hypothetical protein
MAEIERDAALRYLLGEGAEAEREALERRFFEDEELAEEVEILENELVDEYVALRLPPGERGRFEKAYLSSPDRAAKVQFARALDRRLSGQPSVDRSVGAGWGRFLPLAAALVLGVAGAYLAVRLSESRRELSGLQARKAALEGELATAWSERERLQKQLEAAKAAEELYASQIADMQREIDGTVVFTLAGGLTRDVGQQKTFKIPARASQVRLAVAMPSDDYASYSAVVRTPEGREVWKQVPLTARHVGSSLALDVTVPARLLASGDYVVTVQGSTPKGRLESVGDFALRVRRQ